jgi:menaquinone reductase, molybdopterin-binding-like subunit
MNITRRDLFKFAGGSALGAFFTPMPWKLLDDVAIWTQNWSLVPRLPRGPISERYSTCTLCPGACALKARCVSEIPVSLSGVPNHPISHGSLCPVGLGGHHLAYHPLRLTQPMRFDSRAPESRLSPVPFEDVIARIASAITSAKPGEAVALLDQQPERVLSEYYQEFVRHLPNGLYLQPPARECMTIVRIKEMLDSADASWGLEYEQARTLLSFGAPLIDGWGTPGRIIRMLNDRKANGLRLIQVESRQSRTALKADRWLPIRPGTEAILALGIAHIIISEKLYPAGIEKAAADFTDYAKMIGEFTPAAVAETTGINSSDIIATARELAQSGPAIVIAGCDPAGGPLGKSAETAIAGLNLLIGSVGRQGGVISRRPIPGSGKSDSKARQLADVPDGSIRLLIMDASESGYAFPWKLLERKLVSQDALVVSFSAHVSGSAAFADYIIPTPAHLESLQEALGPSDSTRSTFSLSPPLLPAVNGTREPVEIIGKLAQATGLSNFRILSMTDLLKERVRSIHQAKSGTLFSFSNAEVKSVAEIASEDQLWKAFNEGATWIDAETDQRQPDRFRLLALSHDDRNKWVDEVRRKAAPPLMLMPVGYRASITEGQISPVLSKLYQESELRTQQGHASVNPDTALAHDVADGENVRLKTGSGSMEIKIHHDKSVMPGVIYLAVGPAPNGGGAQRQHVKENFLTLCDLADNGTWRLTPAAIEKV